MADETPLGIAAARVTRLRDGRIIAQHCLLRYSQPMTQQEAVERVQAGQVAFVERKDIHQVLDALGVPMQ